MKKKDIRDIIISDGSRIKSIRKIYRSRDFDDDCKRIIIFKKADGRIKKIFA